MVDVMDADKEFGILPEGYWWGRELMGDRIQFGIQTHNRYTREEIWVSFTYVVPDPEDPDEEIFRLMRDKAQDFRQELWRDVEKRLAEEREARAQRNLQFARTERAREFIEKHWAN